MKTIFLMSFFIAIATGAVISNSRNAHILRYENEMPSFGGYNFAYETSDGSHRQEEAELLNPGSEQESISVRGSYSWIADDGKQYVVQYIADDNGFQPQGSHLPN